MPTKVVGRRVAAHLIDALVYSVVAAASWFALTTKVPGKCTAGGVTIGGDCHGFDASGKRIAWLLILLVTGLVIYVILPAVRGTSPGHAAVGVRIVKEDGSPPGFGRAIVRWLLWIVDGFPYVIPDLVGFIVALTSKRNQRVGDMAAGTFVVEAAAAGRPVPQPAAAFGAPVQQAAVIAPQAAGAPQVAAGAYPPGWYPDPHGQARLRWWDGQAWTEQTSA